MPKKKVSETISQQRKARQDFLELKKMQNGEMAVDDAPKIKTPLTFKEKLQNFWFYYKVHTISIICAVLILIVGVSQCNAKTNWDMWVVYFSYSPVLDEQIKPIGTYLEKISTDLNGDGEVNIQMINCSMVPDNKNYKYNQSVLTKVQSIIASEEKAMLFIFDSDSREYFEAEALGDFFQAELTLGDNFYRKTKTAGYDPLPENLQIAVRRVKDTTLEKIKDSDKIHKEALRILEYLEKKG